MNIRKLPIDQLKPAPYNPRVALAPGSPGYRRLERSLAEFDLVQPIVWNEHTGHVVAGHQRIEILRNRGVTEIDCVVVDLPLEREKALNVALNNSQVGGDWDPAKLVDVIEELTELPDFDATLTGFDPDDLNDLLLAPVAVLPEDEDDDEANDCVRVTLEIPSGEWDAVRPELDRLVADRDLKIHVRMP
jgi:ParB-like chromosome segregation protein Spo0J